MADRIITPEAILSYPHLFEPQVDRKGKEKYGCALVFPEGTDISAMKKAAVGVLVDRFGKEKTKELLKTQADDLLPFRNDWEKKGYPEGSVFMNVRTTRKPGIVSTVPDPKNNGRPMVIDDPDEMYPGARVRASIRPFWYDVDGNRGVSFALNNLQKVGEGDRLDNFVAAADEFDADEDAVADLDDLTEPEAATEDEDDLEDLLG